MRRAGGKDGGEDKVMGPLFPRLHVNDTTLKGGGPRAPPRNKMALYEQFSVPSQRFAANAANTAPAAAHRPAASYAAVSSASAGQIGGIDRPLFPSFCVPSNEPVRLPEHIKTNSSGRDGHATSGRLSTLLKSKDAYAAGSTAECSSSQRRDNNSNNNNNTKNSSGKKLTHDDDFTVPSVFCSGVRPRSNHEEVRIQENSTPFPATSPYKSGPTLSKPTAKFPNTDKRYLEGRNASDTRSMDSPSIIRDKAPANTTTNFLEAEERTSSFQFSAEKTMGKRDDKGSSYSRVKETSSINVSDKQHSRNEGHQARTRNENAAESQNAPKAGNGPYSTDIACNGASKLSEKGLRETGEKRKRSTGHHDLQRDDSSDSSVESLPDLEISPDDVVGAIGPKHFWKARRAIVNQQRVFAVQVFELHRLIKVQKLIAASPHLLIEGDPCLGSALVTSKKKTAAANVEKQLLSAKSKDDDDAQLTLQQAEYSKDNTEGNQASPSQDNDVVEVRHENQAASNGAVSSNPPAMPAPPDNKQNNWCAPPPQNQWLVPVMSPSEGFVYKPYTGPCPPAGSILAPFYASCAPLSLPSTAGEFMNSPYGIPMPHQPQHMGVGGPPAMPPMYFPPFSVPVMNPVVSSSAVEQVSRVAAARPNTHVEHHSRSSCNMRNEAVSAGGVWRFHSSRGSELQRSSAASSPFDRQQGQGEARGPAAAAPAAPLPTSSAGNGNAAQQPQVSSGSQENPVAAAARVIRVVPHTARTASESAARIFRSIQMERQQNGP
uniref:EARLY FLOWERING 3 (ELF3) n=1 Tax=Triticum monococcum subsp. monococcum TaxID=408188 RepID=A0A140D7W7_TRIMO|nr:EARLY FLOWERING 3 (ELF3) [Triticum monococcum subsp. monococcum]AMK08991.1 EARLY FLOWERING 3 (ELF3) [Triticum monococcum subsp. monococcum]